MKISFKVSVLFIIAILSLAVNSLPVGSEAENSSIDVTDDQSENLMNKLAKICTQITHTEVWYSLNKNFKSGCLQIILNNLSDNDLIGQDMLRERRFFSVGNGQLNKYASTGSKGFKYGKK